MPPLSVSQVLAVEYREATNDCPPAGCESPDSVVTAPSGVVQSRGTRQPSRNRLQWLHVSLFLEDLPKRGGVPS